MCVDGAKRSRNDWNCAEIGAEASASKREILLCFALLTGPVKMPARWAVLRGVDGEFRDLWSQAPPLRRSVG